MKQCPLTMVSDDVWELISAADLYAKGMPPVAGGTLDQAYSFVAGCRAVWAEEAAYKARLWKR